MKRQRNAFESNRFVFVNLWKARRSPFCDEFDDPSDAKRSFSFNCSKALLKLASWFFLSIHCWNLTCRSSFSFRSFSSFCAFLFETKFKKFRWIGRLNELLLRLFPLVVVLWFVDAPLLYRPTNVWTLLKLVLILFDVFLRPENEKKLKLKIVSFFRSKLNFFSLSTFFFHFESTFLRSFSQKFVEIDGRRRAEKKRIEFSRREKKKFFFRFDELRWNDGAERNEKKKFQKGFLWKLDDFLCVANLFGRFDVELAVFAGVEAEWILLTFSGRFSSIFIECRIGTKFFFSVFGGRGFGIDFSRFSSIVELFAV